MTLVKRIIKLFAFKKEVYSEVAQDPYFTLTAWAIVTVISFLVRLEGVFPIDEFTKSYPGRILFLFSIEWILAILGFAVISYSVLLLGKYGFKSDVTAAQIVRVGGLVYVWNILGVVNIFFFSFPVTTYISYIGSLLAIISYVFAIREVLDLRFFKTIVSVVFGLVNSYIVYISVLAVLYLFRLISV